MRTTEFPQERRNKMDYRAKPFESYVKVGVPRSDGRIPSWPLIISGLFRELALPPERQVTIEREDAMGRKKPVKATLSPAMLKAISFWSGVYQQGSEGEITVAFYDVNATTCVVEYCEEGVTTIVKYNGETGEISGIQEKYKGATLEPYALHSATPSDATAFWLSVLYMLESQKTELGEMLKEQKKLLTESAKDEMHEKEFYAFAEISYTLYQSMTGSNTTPSNVLSMKFGDSDECLLPFTLADLSVENEEILYGEPYLVKEKAKKAKKKRARRAVVKPIDPGEVSVLHEYMVRKVSDYTSEERCLIPNLDPEYKETLLDKQIVDALKRTFPKPLSKRITSFYMKGPAGTGKSALVRHLGALLQIPTVYFTCSTGTDESSIYGTIVPVMEETSVILTEEEKKIDHVLRKTGSSKLDMDELAEALSFPESYICEFDPEAAFEMLGTTGSDPGDAIRLRNQLIEDKVKKYKEKTANADTPVLSYKYIPSPIVDAIEKGYLLEIQEPTNVLQQGIFSSLYDVLEKSSVGTLQTPMGTVVRHPDFMCAVTCNTQYNGNRPLAGSFISRLQFPVQFKELTKKEMAERVMVHEGIKDKALAEKIVAVYNEANSRAWDLSHDANLLATMRHLFVFADAIKDEVDPEQAFKRYLLPLLSNDEEEFEIIWESVNELPLFVA